MQVCTRSVGSNGSCGSVALNCSDGSGGLIVHSCTIFLCCLDDNDPHRNPNMNNKDHRVG